MIARKHVIIIGAIVGAVVISVLADRPDRSSPLQTPSKAAEEVPPSPDDVLIQAFKSGFAYPVKALPEGVRDKVSVAETLTFTTNGGWMGHDIASMPAENGFIADLSFSSDLLKQAKVLKTCGDRFKSKMCNDQQVKARWPRCGETFKRTHLAQLDVAAVGS